MNDKMRITIEILNTGLEEDILRKGEWKDDSLFGKSLRNALMHFTKESFYLNCMLDKLRAEIIAKDKNVKAVRSDGCCFFTAEEVLEIIDKYRARIHESTYYS